MKPAARYPHFDPFTLSAFLAEAMLFLVEALEVVGAGAFFRACLLKLAVDVRNVLFMRAAIAADVPARAAHLPRLFHKHTYLTQRAILRAMRGKHLRTLTRGDDRARIEAMLHAIDHADEIVAAIKARILRRTGRFNVRRLVYTPPRTRDFASARLIAPAIIADTS